MRTLRHWAEWGDGRGRRGRVHGTRARWPPSGIPYASAGRDVGHDVRRSQKRLVLESCLRGNDGVLLTDEEDNYLDVPGKALARAGTGQHDKTVLVW